ncbi:MAG TPA: cytochrome c [Candidatus Angelobacter sp.]|nr:cytochrome c [Candidatus Angelobacter sp.]
MKSVIKHGIQRAFLRKRLFRIFVVVPACLFGVGILLRAHTFYSTKITWSADVSRIVYSNCASCHHPGGSAFSLMTYREARPWAESIKHQVLTRSMPPWNAVKGFGEFKNDRGLSQENIEIIAEWIEGGAPEGNPLYMPPQPTFGKSTTNDRAVGSPRDFLGVTTLKHPLDAVGIVPKNVPDTGVLQVIAERPDGSIEPLIWVEKFNPTYTSPYYFRKMLNFPAGTKIEVTPHTGSVSLLIK